MRTTPHTDPMILMELDPDPYYSSVTRGKGAVRLNAGPFGQTGPKSQKNPDQDHPLYFFLVARGQGSLRGSEQRGPAPPHQVQEHQQRRLFLKTKPI